MLSEWCKEYSEQKVDVTELQTEIDAYMADYDRRQEEEKEKALESEGVPDDEGWITVTRHGKNKGAPRTEAMESRVTTKDKRKRKRKVRS